MSEKNKPLIDTIWKGEIKDSRGRVIKLRSPTVWDEYQLCKVMGADSENSRCLIMGEMLLRVAAIDSIVMSTPSSYNEFSTNLNILSSEGIAALVDHAKANDEAEGGEDKVKK